MSDPLSPHAQRVRLRASVRAAPDPSIAERWNVASYLVFICSARNAFMELNPIFASHDFALTPETRASSVGCVWHANNPSSRSTAPLTKLIGMAERYVELCELLVKEAIIWEAWRACGADQEEPIGKQTSLSSDVC